MLCVAELDTIQSNNNPVNESEDNLAVFSLDIDYNNPTNEVNCDSSKICGKIYSALHLPCFTNKAKRRFFWYVCESERNNYRSYKDFKKH